MEIFDNLKEKCEQIRSDSFYAPYLEELGNAYALWKDEPIPDLEYKDFISYFQTGSRAEYEEKYFSRRKHLAQAVLLFILYEKEEYLEKICELVWAVCSEITWAVPAHLAKEKICDYRGYIDLFAAETAHALAETAVLLKNKLPAPIYDLIVTQVTERTFDSYESRPHFWEGLVSNWPGVCAGSIGAAYLLLTPERFEKVRDRIFSNLQQFIKSYGDDGSNTEGISYWQYGFWCYLNFADLLYRHSEHKADLLHGGKIQKMAEFLPKISLRKNITVSFSDGGREYGFNHIGLYNYLIRSYENIQIPAEKPSELLIAKNEKLPWLLRDFFWSDPHQYDTIGKFKESTEYLPDAQWFIVKRKTYSFAAKAGHNNEGHNHNDVGSFIFADDNGQMLTDLGAMEYTAKSFSNLRYTILSNSSLGHSVPIVNGNSQKDGAQYRAKVLQADKETFAMELQDAYGENNPKIIRSFTVKKDGIILSDAYENIENYSYTERFVSIVKPCLSESVLRIGNVIIHTQSRPDITCRELSDHQRKMLKVWLIDFPVTENEFKIDVEVEDVGE